MIRAPRVRTIAKGKYVHKCPKAELDNGKVVYSIDLRDVRVMASAEGYAMVRRLGCIPYVCLIEELETSEKP